MKLKRIFILFLSLSMLFNSGCWDMIEIDKRALIGAIVIDIIEKDEDDGDKGKTSPFCEDKPDIIRVTFALNNASKLQKGGGEGVAIFENVNAANVPDAMEKLGSRTSRLPFYGQSRILVLTDKLVKNEKIFRAVLDEFERKAIINQQMKIVVIKGSSEDFLKVDPKLEAVRSQYIIGILENSRVLSNTVSRSLTDLLVEMRNNEGTAVIPVLEVQLDNQSHYSIDKLALIKDYKLLTILDSKYVKAYKIIKQELRNGRKLIEYKGITVPFYIFGSNRRIWLEEDKDVLKYKVKVELEGDIEQFQFDKMLFDPKVIADIEKTLDESILKELEATTAYFQMDIEHDFLGFKEYTNKYHYKIFKRYENNWDEAFKNANIEYEVDAKIRRIGTSKQ